MIRRHWFAVSYGLILAIATLAGVEAIASFYAPRWPARALRSAEPTNINAAVFKSLADKPWMFQPFNSWGMADRERTLAKPPGVSFRSIFIGDSFIESALARYKLPEVVERRLGAAGKGDVEAVNLGISATNPRSYFYRLRDVALAMSPDALLVFFYSGNDFVPSGAGYGDEVLPPLVDESPGSSVFGHIMPRSNWLAVNRLRLSEALRGNRPIPDEFETLYAIVHGPPSQRVPGLVRHVKRYYHPDVDAARLSEILSRGGDEFWNALRQRPIGEEYLMGWLLNLLVWTELNEEPDLTRRERGSTRLAVDEEVEASLSWLLAMERVARARGVPLVLFLIPVASVDPQYVEFWKPWPRYLSWSRFGEERHRRLAALLQRTSIHVVDLRSDLADVPGTYRKMDGHWTEKGVDLVSSRVQVKVEKLSARK
jgi:hypothetical protein